jgi:hypothetical protein
MWELLLARTLPPHSTQLSKRLGDKVAYISVQLQMYVCMLNTVNPLMENKGFEVKIIC